MQQTCQAYATIISVLKILSKAYSKDPMLFISFQYKNIVDSISFVYLHNICRKTFISFEFTNICVNFANIFSFGSSVKSAHTGWYVQNNVVYGTYIDYEH